MRILVTGANGQVGHELLRAFESPPLQGEGMGGDGVHADVLSNTIPTQRYALGLRPPPLKGRGNSDRAYSKTKAAHLRACEIIPATRNGELENGMPCERIDLADDAKTLHAALDRIAPDLIVNAAAYTAVDRAEDEPELAQRVNGDAPGLLGMWAARHGARVVHYSTDYVFDGAAAQPYREDDAPRPLGVYGCTKLAGEIALRDSGARHLIFRSAWVYAARGHNFLRTMLRLGAEREELRVVDDQIGAPTPARLIADVTVLAIARWYANDDALSARLDGVYHLAASGRTSWCGFARTIFERAARAGLLARGQGHPPRRAARAFASAPPLANEGAGLYPLPEEGGREATRAQRGAERAGVPPRITAITTADYPTRARRPEFSVLDTAKLRTAFGVQLPDWQAALDEVMGEMTNAG